MKYKRVYQKKFTIINFMCILYKMYRKIVNPETGRKVNINGKIGKKIVNNYLTNYIGGSVGFIVDKSALRESFLFSILGAEYRNKWEVLTNIPYEGNIEENFGTVKKLLFSFGRTTQEGNPLYSLAWALLYPRSCSFVRN